MRNFLYLTLVPWLLIGQTSVALKPSLQKFAIRIAGPQAGQPADLQKDSRGIPPAGLVPKSVILPTSPVTDWATGSNGVLWLGTAEGLIRVDAKARDRDRVQYFAGPRYLPDNNVLRIEPEGQNVWVRTRSGVAKIELRSMTLAEKAAHFEKRVVERHNRHGMVADSHLLQPGKLESNQMVSNDNDGLWTAMYAAAKCYEYAVTKSEAARKRAREATEAVLFLEQITSRPGFPARSYIKKGEPKPSDGVWHPAKTNPDITWKADTSSDEIVGHFYIFALAYDLLPDADLKQRIVATAKRIMDHILEHDLNLIDVTGKPTRWGRWNKEYFASETGKPDAPLNALEILSFLKTTHHLTGDPRYEREYQRLAWQEGYADLTTKYLELQEELNYSDEELAMLSFYPLFRYEKDPKALAVYRKALDTWWQNGQRELNPLWTWIYLVGKPGSTADVEGAAWTLHRIPMDLIKWPVKNSHRADVKMATGIDRHSRPEALTLLPPDERPVMKWNGNPFVLDSGGSGSGEDDGAFYLLPYWMGRHYGFLRGE